MENDNRNYTGFYKDFLDGRAGLATTDSVFSNSDCMFCEFNDIITPTWLGIIDNLRRVDLKYIDISTRIFNLQKVYTLDDIIDLSIIKNMNPDELIKWYAVREHRNALLDLKKDNIDIDNHIIDFLIDSITNKLFADKIAYYNIEDNPFLLNYAYTLTKTLRVASNIIKKFVIYVEQCNDEVDKFITHLYGSKVQVRSGDLVSALGDIPNTSTFVFSDVYKINALIKAGKINGASILLADGFGYNYRPNMIGKNEGLLVDIDKLLDVYDFQFNAFNNFTDE